MQTREKITKTMLRSGRHSAEDFADAPAVVPHRIEKAILPGIDAEDVLLRRGDAPEPDYSSFHERNFERLNTEPEPETGFRLQEVIEPRAEPAAAIDPTPRGGAWAWIRSLFTRFRRESG